MTYAQLKRYISDLAASGVNVVPQTVLLYRKLSFPFVTLIMTLIAVPFAVTTGQARRAIRHRRGISIAVVYWITINTFTRDRQRRDAAGRCLRRGRPTCSSARARRICC